MPDSLSHFGPARLAVKRASDAEPVAFELRNASCSDAYDAYDAYVACIDEFFTLDGSCRTGDAFLNRPFSGLVAIPKTDFTDICTSGCEEFPTAGTLATLPTTTDRDGNAVFAMVYADQLVREDRGDGLIEPKPRRLNLSVADAANNGFTDDAPAVYAAKPSSFTFEGFPLSPPFNPFVDPTIPVGDIGIWGMADAEATVHFLPRRACSGDLARACNRDADCVTGSSCGLPEFSFVQDGSAIELPISSAGAHQAFELNSWLDGGLDGAAVAIVEDERLGGIPVNADGAADDIVVELLDRGTGLLKRLSGAFLGRGLTQVRVVENEEDYVIPSVAAEDRVLAFLELEFAEGLANPLGSTTGAEARSADVNGNNRLDQNLRVYSLPEDPTVEQASSLLAEGLDVAVVADGRFDERQNLVLSDGKLFFAYSPSQQQAHAYQLVNQSSEGEPANSFSGQANLSSNGSHLAFVSGADNLFVPGPIGEMTSITSGGTVIEAVRGPYGEFPILYNGRSIFKYHATDDAMGPAPSRVYLELPVCNSGANEPDLVALVNLSASGPNADLAGSDSDCPGCEFPGSSAVEFSRGISVGGDQYYWIAFDSLSVPTGEIGVNLQSGGEVESTSIRGPACVDAQLTPDIERVYLRNIEAGTTQLVSIRDRSSCDERVVPTNEPSGNPDVTESGRLIFFDSVAGLTNDDQDTDPDVYVYDPATCDVVNLSADLSEPARNPSSSDDGTIVAFEAGIDPEIVVLNRTTGVSLSVGLGRDPSFSADGTKLVYTAEVGGVAQVFLVEVSAGSTGPPIAVSVTDGEFFALGVAAPSVANTSSTAFETPPEDVDSRIFVRDVDEAVTTAGSTLPTGENLCTSSPCGAFSVSISDDGRFLAYVVRGLGPVDEIVIKDLTTGAITPLTRMAGADADSLEPNLGASGDFLALTSFSSQLAGVVGAGEPNVFLEGPADPSIERDVMLGVLDLSSCAGAGSCTPTLTNERVTKGASFEGDLGVVGSPVRLIETGGAGGLSVRSFTREGFDVALAANWICSITNTDGSGSSGRFAACGNRSGSTLTDLTVDGLSLSAEKIGLCGDRAIALGANGVLYQADLGSGFAAQAIQVAQDFELGTGIDLNEDGAVDSCLVAFRALETDLGGSASQVGNRDLDTEDLAMFVLGTDDVVTDCGSSATDCPGQACAQFNYQVGSEAVVFLVDEFEENFGFTPGQDVCSPGTDVNSDGLCDVSVRRCTAAGSLTSGTSFGQAGNIFSNGRFPDGENTVTEAGFCGSSPSTVRIGQLCSDDLDCLSQLEESCQQGVVILSALADTDKDEIPDVFDNCPLVFNPDQANTDAEDPLLESDRFGDACDALTCGDGIVQSAEACDEGSLNGTPGSGCSAGCGCGVQFAVSETLKPGSKGNTPIVVFGSAAPDGSGCVNLDTNAVGGLSPKNIDVATLRLSATPPTQSCPSSGGAPIHDLTKRYASHFVDSNSDGIKDLKLHMDTPPIGGDSSTTVLYLTGRFSETSGGSAGQCFVSVAPVKIAAGK